MRIKTKANTLINISSKIKIFHVPKSYIFTVNDWIRNKSLIKKKIKQMFSEKEVIIRSSTSSEDSQKASFAGAFESFLNIDSKNSKKIELSINKVIKSYKSKISNIRNEQILVQEMIQNIKMSGVIFTGDNFGYQNYYSINYDDITGRTDTVTSGNSEYSNKTLFIFKKKKKLVRSSRFKKLIKATQEIENFFTFPLDIEFCLTKKNKLFLLQVRPIVLQKKTIFKEKEIVNKLSKEYKNLQNSFIKKKGSNIFGKYSFFSQMTDWNPAEMIGQLPSRLSYSLYSSLITDDSWFIARKYMGYNHINDIKLMQNFAGRPFIDVRKSLNSFFPRNISKSLGNKLINESIQKLKLFPSLHDKVEFELIPTGFSFLIKEKLKKMNVYSKQNLTFFEKKLTKMFIKNLDLKSDGSVDKNLKKIEKLKNKHHTIDYKVDIDLNKINKIIKETKKYGIIPFSILARHGFIAKDLLLSLKIKKIISEKDVDSFLRSFSTITTEFLNDQIKLNKNKISYKYFINKYGHLRAGTYDIKSVNYKNLGKKILLKVNTNKIIVPSKFSLDNKKKNKIQKLLNKNSIPMDVNEFFLYMQKSIQLREYGKFIFSKSIDIILEKIKIFSKFKKIKLKDIENLTVREILSTQKVSRNKIINKISQMKRHQLLNQTIKLPEIIVEKENAYIGASVLSNPNFITDKNITSKMIYLDSSLKQNLDNKIILLENADPGYDFVFSYKIKGLITKYGGANSHMTIRCNELNIPAAIGCGESIFSKLKNADQVNLNCKNLIIRTE